MKMPLSKSITTEKICIVKMRDAHAIKAQPIFILSYSAWSSLSSIKAKTVIYIKISITSPAPFLILSKALSWGFM